MINYDGLRGGLPDWAKDGIHVTTDVHMDWRDRLRVLFGHTVTVRTTTFCEGLPGRTDSVAQVYVHSDRLSKMLGIVTLEAPPPPQPGAGEPR